MLAVWCLFYVSEMAWAGTNDTSPAKALLQDTLKVIRGKVFDSLLNKPIPFASITYYRDDSVSVTILSNQKGEFSVRTNKSALNVQISAVGYQETILYLAGDRNNLLRLVVATVSLPNVIVSSKARKKADADWIIKRFNKRFKENYGDLSFDQKFKVNWEGHNYDTTKFEMTAQLFYITTRITNL